VLPSSTPTDEVDKLTPIGTRSTAIVPLNGCVSAAKMATRSAAMVPPNGCVSAAKVEWSRSRRAVSVMISGSYRGKDNIRFDLVWF